MTDSPFSPALTAWRPPPVDDTDQVTNEGAQRFSAMLDIPCPVKRRGDELPPLWHWFLFPEVHQQRDLGEDGHPREGSFLPPVHPRRRVFGGGRLTIHQPMRVGETIRRHREIVGARETSSSTGHAMLVVTERRSHFISNVLVAVEEHDIVYLHPATSPQPYGPPIAGGSPDDTPDSCSAPWHLTVPTDPVLLFRFSALTLNTHRIHYDLAYARDVEGHQGLLVHGPLLALLLLELPRRHAPDRVISSFTWRSRAPLHVGAAIHVDGYPRDDRVTLYAAQPGAERAVVGEATLQRR